MPEISKRRQLPKDVISDEEKQKALYQDICQSNVLDIQNMTPPWYLSNSRYPMRDGNSFNIYKSGEDVFRDIAHSILNAKKSVDIIATFFDPAMLLTREHANYTAKRNDDNAEWDKTYSAWDERDSFGGIIINALDQNPDLKIRLVLWRHEGNQSLTWGPTDSNLVGVDVYPEESQIPYTELATGFDIRKLPDASRSEYGLFTREETRKYRSLKLRQRTAAAAAYSRQWFQRVAWEVENRDTGSHRLFDRLCIVRRAITTPWSLDQEDPTFPAEDITRQIGCDHQKTVLIDLDATEHDNADPHGYVLGHNYFTQYWSHFPFVHRDTRHEMDYAPYHDFSMQIRGPLLIDLNHNFCHAYGLEVPPEDRNNNEARMQRLGILTSSGIKNPLKVNSGKLPTDDKNVHYDYRPYTIDDAGTHYKDEEEKPKTYANVDYITNSIDGYTRPERALEKESPRQLYEDRKKLEALYSKAAGGKASGQIVRTRPDQLLHGAQEKEIKDAYLQVVRHASNFILIVNQYFQYNKLARQIKYWKNIANEAFVAQCANQEPRTLYMFLGTCKPERHQMVFRTQQMANEFGVGDQFGTAFDEMYDKDKADPKDGNRRPPKTKTMRYRGASVEMSNVSGIQPMGHVTSSDMDALHIRPLFFMFYTQIPPKEQRSKNPADNEAQQIYVHAKLMIEDDAFFTLGSSNANIRSFAVDSELNVISDDKDSTVKLRQELLAGYTGITVQTAKFQNKSELLGQVELKSIYEEMLKIADLNSKLIKKQETIQGLIALFDDDRTVNVARYM